MSDAPLKCPACQAELDPLAAADVCPHCGVPLMLDLPADDDGQKTVDHIGDATIELPAPSDDTPPANDPNATIDLTGEQTIEFGGEEGVSLELEGADDGDEAMRTQDFAADATIDFGAQGKSDKDLEDSISLSWGDAAGKTVRQDQTIQIGKTVSGFRSSLPIKSRALKRPDQEPGSATLGSAETAPDYELIDMLGQGGMGVVYTAKQSSIARTVAVKMLKPGGGSGSGSQGSEDQRDKFISEAVITGELEHPNIVPIYDLGANDEGALFYSMKRVRGTPWDEVIGDKSMTENLGILMRVADAVAFAHANGVIHRDLKPENVMLGGFGEVLVMDWGLARVTEEFSSAESVYQAESLGGTPAYMAPEMTTGPVERIDARSDVYLLGAILYEIIGGKPPHTGKDAMACLMSASKNVLQPIEYRGELLGTALRAMATKQDDRFQTVKEFQESVQEYLSHMESIALSESAARNLEQARAAGEYELYSRALYGFQEATELWDENENAKTGTAETRLEYARTAKDKGDYDLGASLLEAPIEGSEAEQAELLEEIRVAQAERVTRQRRLRDLKRMAVALLVAVVGITSYSYFEIRKQKNEAVAQKEIAEEQRGIAQKQERIAVREKELADQARDAEAEQRAVAEEQRALAQQNEKLAKENEQQAIAARAVAEEAKANEAYEAYVARIGLASEKIEENAFREALALLEACPTEMRQWEWGRLRRLCDLSENVYDLGAPVHAVAYSPDGKRMASGDWNGAVTVRATDGGEQLWRAEPGGYVHTLTFSGDGAKIAVGTSRGVIHLLDAVTGADQGTLEGHEEGVLAVDFSSDGAQLVSGGYDETVRVWDLATRQENQRLRGHSWWVWAAEFSADDSRLVTAGQDGKAIVWCLVGDAYERLTEFTGHEGPVYDATFSPDGASVATCGYDETVCVWDAEVGRTIDIRARLEGVPDPPRTDTQLHGHTGPVRSVDFAPDGKRVLSGGQDNTLRVWDLGDDSSIALRGHGGRVRSVAFSPDGLSALSGAEDNEVRTWDIGGYQEERVLSVSRLRGHVDAILAARFSDDGSRIVTASRDRTAMLWGAEGRTPLLTLDEGHEFLASSARLFDDAKLLATSAGDNTTRLWDVDTGVELHHLEQTGRSAALAVAPSGEWLVTGGPTGTVRWWRVSDGEPIQQSDTFDEDVTSLAISPDGEVIASGDDLGRIRLWRRGLNGEWEPSALLQGHSRTITGLAFTPNGSWLISSSGDRTCGQWDVATGKELRDKVLKHPEWVSAMSMSADGTMVLTACDDGYARLWRLADASEIVSIQSEDSIYNDVALSPDANQALLTSAAKQSVYRWDIDVDELTSLPAITRRGGLVWSARYADGGWSVVTVGGNDARLWRTGPLRPTMQFSPNGAVSDAAISPDRTLIATASWDGSAKLWDAQSGDAVRKLIDGHTGFINSIDFASNEELLTAGDDGRVRFWDSVSGEIKPTMLEGHTGRVLQARYAQDGDAVLTASSDKTARLWDRQTGEQRLLLRGHEWAVTSVAASPDGRLIVTGSEDNTAIVWDAESGEQLHRLAGHSAGVSSVAVSPDGRRVLTGSLDGSARLWDTRTGKELLSLLGHREEVTSVRFSPDGRSALTASRDGAAIIWPAAAW